MIYDHAQYDFVREMATLPRKSSLHYEIARGYHTYQSMWVAVGNKLPCQREQANYEDPFAVAVMKGELIVGGFPNKLSAVCSVLLRQSGVNSPSLDTRLDGNALSFLNLSAKNFPLYGKHAKPCWP